MRALCESHRALDHDAEIHRADIAAHGELTVPVLATGGGVQTLAANYQATLDLIEMLDWLRAVPDQQDLQNTT